MPRRRAREVEIVAEIRRQACNPGEDRQREARHDLVRAQRDDEKRMDGRHRRSGERRDADRADQRHARRRVEALHRPEAHHGSDEHHPLDTEVEHARPLGEQLAERCVEQRRAVGDPLRDHDDQQCVVHAASGAVPCLRSMRTR